MARNKLDNKTSDTIYCFASGGFGEAVASVLRENFPEMIEVYSDTQNPIVASIETYPQAQWHILTSWRPAARYCHAIEEISYRQKSIFIPVVMNGALLQIGPVVVPGTGACYSCYEKRFFQHTQLQSQFRDIYNYYDTHPESGPRGYLHAVADLAAMHVMQIMQRLEREPERVAGHLWQWNSMTFEGLESMVTGIHACPRCGLQRNEATRSYEELQQVLASLFSYR